MGKAVVANESTSFWWTLIAAGQGPTEDLMLLSKINSQSHCTVNDQFQGQMQGTGHTSGRVKLGALRERYWMLYRTPKPSPPALAAPILPPAG